MKSKIFLLSILLLLIMGLAAPATIAEDEPLSSPMTIGERDFWFILPTWGWIDDSGAASFLYNALVKQCGWRLNCSDVLKTVAGETYLSFDYKLAWDLSLVQDWIDGGADGKPVIATSGHWRYYNDFGGMGDEKYPVDRTSLDEWKQSTSSIWMGFEAGEWDNDFLMAKERGLFYNEAGDRYEALEQLRDWFGRIETTHMDEKIVGMCSGWPWTHYALEWGGAGNTIETTGLGNPSHQVELAFARGASRQYQKPWGWYVAYFAYNRDYPDALRENKPYHGISISLAERDYYLAYFGGANYLTFESWPEAFFQDSNGDGIWELSPHGQAVWDFHDFTSTYPDRATPYTPVALLVDYYHGWSSNERHEIFYGLPYEGSDYMLDVVFHTIFPWKEIWSGDTRLYNSPYGDLYDVLVANPPSGALNSEFLSSYPVAMLVGDVTINGELAQNLVDYVHGGGLLVVSAGQIKGSFPTEILGAEVSGEESIYLGPVFDDEGQSLWESEQTPCLGLSPNGAETVLSGTGGQVLATENSFGEGKVILLAPKWLTPQDIEGYEPAYDYDRRFPFVEYVLNRVVESTRPFEIEGDIEYGVNAIEDGWLVYLINNNGVQKEPDQEQVLDPDAASTVQIKFHQDVSSIREVVADDVVHQEPPGSFSVTVPPGGVRALEVKLSPVAGLVAEFSASPTTGDTPLDVQFTDQSTGSITSWSWDFGDGATSTEQNPLHTYSSAGVYTVSLTVTDSLTGNSDTMTKTNYITVYNSGYLPGDADGDGDVDMADVNRVERIILELDPETPGADANQDGDVDLGDVTKIELIIIIGD